MKKHISKVVQWFMNWVEHDIYWEEEDLKTPTGLLRFWDSLGAQILEVGFFLSVAWTTWHRFGRPEKSLRDINDWVPYLSKAVPPCFLVVLFGVMYWASR